MQVLSTEFSVERPVYLDASLDRQVNSTNSYGIELKSLILAQIERWRNALHMQVERQRGATWRRAANG